MTFSIAAEQILSLSLCLSRFHSTRAQANTRILCATLLPYFPSLGANELSQTFPPPTIHPRALSLVSTAAAFDRNPFVHYPFPCHSKGPPACSLVQPAGNSCGVSRTLTPGPNCMRPPIFVVLSSLLVLVRLKHFIYKNGPARCVSYSK